MLMRLTLFCIVRVVLAALPPAEFIPDENPAILRDPPLIRTVPTGPERSTLGSRQLQPHEVMNITSPTNFWFGSGPTYYDVVQKKFSDCWLAAASSAIVIASPDWMSRLFVHVNGTPVIDSYNPSMTHVQVLMWNPNTRQPQFFLASVYNQSRTEDHPGERWWHSAIIQSMLRLGAQTDIPGINGHNATFGKTGDAGAALTALTGYTSQYKYREYYDNNEDKLYEDLSKAYDNHTPIVVSTIPNNTANNTFTGGSVLYGTHAYAVLWTDQNPADGTKTALLRNPWGSTVEATLGDIIKHMNRVVHLEYFRGLNWTEAVGGST